MMGDGSDPSQRFVTMSLGSTGASTIGSRQSEGRRANLNISRNVNDVSDIRGTKPLMKAYQYTKRPKLWEDTSDIKGSTSKVLHPKNPNKVIGRNLNNDDIEYSKPQMYTFQTKRQSNPICPEYAAPGHSEPVPAASVRKQTVTTNQTEDIKGAKPRVPLASRYAMRDHHSVSDIDGCTTTWRPRHQRRNEWAPRNGNYDCSDINDIGWSTKRVSDPLNPCHEIHGRVLGQDPKSKPRALPGARDGGQMPVLSLLTQDIEGAVPGWKPKHQNGGIPEEHRRHFRNMNYVGDIRGAKADSLVRNMPNHGRRTDPLDPQYTDLDGGGLMSSAREHLMEQPQLDSEVEVTVNDIPRLSDPAPPVLPGSSGGERKMSASEEAMRNRKMSGGSGGSGAPAMAWGEERQELESGGSNGYDHAIRNLQQDKEWEQNRIISELQQEIAHLSTERAASGGWMSSRGSSRGGQQEQRRDSRSGSGSQRAPSSRGSIHSRGSRGSGHSYDRMVLKSRNGQPRVPISMADRRAQAELNSDIESVRGL